MTKEKRPSDVELIKSFNEFLNGAPDWFKDACGPSDRRLCFEIYAARCIRDSKERYLDMLRQPEEYMPDIERAKLPSVRELEAQFNLPSYEK